MNRLVRSTPGEITPLVPRSVCAWACFAMALLIPADRHGRSASGTEPPAAVSASAVAPRESPAQERSAFRLGDAAKPFGWSTAIGDFNADGKPDVAVADHIARLTSGYEYRIEFSLSGQAPGNVTFESRHRSVTISVSDVDCDNDLDVIVGAPLSGETVGVWLNDGHGHFTSGDVRAFPAALQPLQALGTTDPGVDPGAFEVSPQRTHDGLPGVFRTVLADSGHRVAISGGRRLWCSSLLLRANPRAPPPPSRDLLS